MGQLPGEEADSEYSDKSAVLTSVTEISVRLNPNSKAVSTQVDSEYMKELNKKLDAKGAFRPSAFTANTPIPVSPDVEADNFLARLRVVPPNKTANSR